MFKKVFVFLFCLNQVLLAQTDTTLKIVKADTVLKELKVTVMLPFCSKEILATPNSSNLMLSNVCREYYQGMLLALDSIGKTPIGLRLKVIDSKKDSNTIKKALLTDFVKESNLVIGPALKEGQVLMANYSKQYKTLHVSPFVTLTKSKIIDPYFISYNPSLSSYADYLMHYLSQSGFENINLIVVQGKDKNDDLLTKRFKSLKNIYPEITVTTVNEINNAEKLANGYLLNKINHVFIASDDEYNVNATLKMLSDTNQFKGVNVFGLKKWLSFKTVDGNVWEQLNVTAITPFYADYANKEIIKFTTYYRERFYAEPTEYAFEGYRQLMFFAQAWLKTNGNFDELDTIKNIKIFGLNNKIGFTDDGLSRQNQKLNLIKFENMRLQQIN